MAEIWNLIDYTETGVAIHRWEIDLTDAEIEEMPREQLEAFLDSLRGVCDALGLNANVAPGVIGKGTA